MKSKKTSVFENGLIWFGAAVSIAEIITGTYIAPLGIAKGLSAIIIGHLIGCILLFLAGVIGGKLEKTAMETVGVSFGRLGSCLFATLNVVQLIGWTGIMINDGAIAAGSILGIPKAVWCVIIGALIILWIVIGINNLGRLNTVAMGALFVLTIVLSFVIFKGKEVVVTFTEAISFGAAVELSVAMPLSWLPLISDYTKDAQKPVKTAAVSAIVYGITSCWMYFIGMGAAIYTGETGVAQIMLKAGLGIIGLLIIVLSTVTTTFLDAYSAGVSASVLTVKKKEKVIAVAVTVLGVIGAVFLPLNNITEFLYFIGSVFAPMIAIMIADFFILKKKCDDKKFNARNLAIWAIGFVVYRFLMNIDIIIGNTVVDVLFVIILCIVVDNVKKAFR